MKIQDNKFDSAFRRRSREIKINPSTDVWQNIDKQLSKRKRFSVYSIIAIAASVFLIVGFLGILAVQEKTFENPNYQVQQVEESDNQDFNLALMNWVDISHRS